MSSAPGVDPARRFLTLADVAEILATSVAQVRALVQSGELRYIQIGGRQQYRIEAVELENYIQRMYAESDAKLERVSPAEEQSSPDLVAPLARLLRLSQLLLAPLARLLRLPQLLLAPQNHALLPTPAPRTMAVSSVVATLRLTSSPAESTTTEAIS